jgi:hypothetical protein
VDFGLWVFWNQCADTNKQQYAAEQCTAFQSGSALWVVWSPTGSRTLTQKSRGSSHMRAGEEGMHAGLSAGSLLIPSQPWVTGPEATCPRAPPVSTGPKRWSPTWQPRVGPALPHIPPGAAPCWSHLEDSLRERQLPTTAKAFSGWEEQFRLPK